jgi:uncharacterized membrane protein
VNWDAIGAVAEVIGALAVLITLIYLALQIRQNTRAINSSALDSTVNTISIARQSIYENDDVARVYLVESGSQLRPAVNVSFPDSGRWARGAQCVLSARSCRSPVNDLK